MQRFAIAALLTTLCAVPALTAPADKEDAAYIKVEIKGTLETGINAIGGETTGTVIHVKNITWELDFGKNEEFQALAKKLNKKTVIVTGTYSHKKGVEVRERHIVKVTGLKAAEEK